MRLRWVSHSANANGGFRRGTWAILPISRGMTISIGTPPQGANTKYTVETLGSQSVVMTVVAEQPLGEALQQLRQPPSRRDTPLGR
jgi:hypothetical protein